MKPFSALSADGRGVARRLFACEDGRRLYAPVAAARPRDLATELRSAPRLEARPGPAAAPGTERAGITARSPARPRRRG